MALYLVSYDLHKHRDYTGIISALEKSGGVRILESTWLGSWNGPAAMVRDNLRTLVDNDDSIFVIEIKAPTDWATINCRKEGVDWLKRYIP